MERSPGIAMRILESASWRAGVGVLRVLRRDMRRTTAPEGADVAFRRLALEDVLALASDPSLDLAAGWARATLALPGGCVGAFVDGRPVGYTWFAFERAPERDGLWVKVPPGAAYRYKSFVRPEHRGQKIAPRLYRFTDRICLEHGRHTAINLVQAHNAASVSALRSTGSEPVGYIVRCSLLGRPVALHSPGTRRLGLRLEPGGPAAGQ